MIAGFESRCRAQGAFHPEDWTVLRLSGRAAGVVFPAFADATREAATNFYVGVVPEFRGRGLAGTLLVRGIETMLARGATRYVGSCVAENVPMRRAFERIGCSKIATRHVFRADA